jgi:hypothetical protein
VVLICLSQGVFAREQADGHHCLFGALLANCLNLLHRIFGMQQERDQLLGRSRLALTADEWRYVTSDVAPLLACLLWCA